MSAPKPPCGRRDSKGKLIYDCPRRTLHCHDVEKCPDWAEFVADTAAWKAKVEAGRAYYNCEEDYKHGKRRT